MSRHDVQFWTNQYGHNAWVFNPGSTPAWRDLRTGEYAQGRPAGVNQPTSASALKVPSQYPYLTEYVSAPATAPASRERQLPIGVDPAFRSYQIPGVTAEAPATTETSGFQEPKLSDPTYDLIDETTGKVVGRNVAKFNADYQDYLDFTSGIGGVAGTGRTGPTGPTAAELAIQRSQIQAQNLSTFISGTIAELELEIDAKRLSTEQALQEFNKRLDAFSEAGERFEGIQPYTIPIGAKYAPGFGPGEIGEQLGIAPRKAEVIQYDPFAMADQIVSESQVLTDIGVPSGDALAEAVKIARGFLGG